MARPHRERAGLTLARRIEGAALAALVIVLPAVLGTAGCTVTERRVVPGSERTPIGDGPKQPSRYERLVEATKKNPNDSRAWVELGEFHEQSFEYPEAADCYERANALIDPAKYTGGNFLLGRIYVKLQDPPRALEHLDAVLDREPKDKARASINPHFREAHALRAETLALLGRSRAARVDIDRYLDLGGDPIHAEELRARLSPD